MEIFHFICRYQSNEEFARDARLVFKNCDIFNEDDSEVLLSFFCDIFCKIFFQVSWKIFHVQD